MLVSCLRSQNIIKTALLTMVLALNSCNDGIEPLALPVNVLSEDSFALVLTDFAIAESAANMNVGNQPVFRLDTAYAFNPVLENGISRARLDSTMAYYAKHPEQYQNVYNKVLDNINAMRKETGK